MIWAASRLSCASCGDGRGVEALDAHELGAEDAEHEQAGDGEEPHPAARVAGRRAATGGRAAAPGPTRAAAAAAAACGVGGAPRGRPARALVGRARRTPPVGRLPGTARSARAAAPGAGGRPRRGPVARAAVRPLAEAVLPVAALCRRRPSASTPVPGRCRGGGARRGRARSRAPRGRWRPALGHGLSVGVGVGWCWSVRSGRSARVLGGSAAGRLSVPAGVVASSWSGVVVVGASSWSPAWSAWPSGRRGRGGRGRHGGAPRRGRGLGDHAKRAVLPWPSSPRRAPCRRTGAGTPGVAAGTMPSVAGALRQGAGAGDAVDGVAQGVLAVGELVRAALEVAHRVRALGHRRVEHEHPDEAAEQERDAQGEEDAVAPHLGRRDHLELARGRARRGAGWCAAAAGPGRAGSCGGSVRGTRRSAARSRAEADRGLVCCSCSSGTSAPRVSRRRYAACSGSSTGIPCGVRLCAPAANACLVIRSSSEWYDSTAIRPPGASTSMAEATARSQTSSSALTSMRRAWKVRLAGWPPVRCDAAGTAARSTSTRRAERGERLLLALAQDGRGDPAGEALLAVGLQDPGEVAVASRC